MVKVPRQCRICLTLDLDVINNNNFSFLDRSVQNKFLRLCNSKLPLNPALPFIICDICRYNLTRVTCFYDALIHTQGKLFEKINYLLDKQEQIEYLQALTVIKEFQLEIPSPSFEPKEEVGESSPANVRSLKRNAVDCDADAPEKRKCLDTDPSLPCPICKLENASAEHLVLHETGPKQCELCRRRLKDQHSLNNHMAIHKRPPKMSICDICGLSVSFRTVAKHKATHLDKVIERKFVCPTCGIDFVKKQHLNRHELHKHLKEKNFACKFCDEKYYQLFDLQQHKISKHLEQLDDIDRPKFRCECCPKLFVSKTSLRCHLTMMMNKKLKKPAGKVECAAAPKPIRCLFCKHRPFDSRQQLHEHCTRVHVKYCALCNKRILSQERFEKHVEQHKFETYKRTYHCKETDCTARFRNSYLLLIHMRSHTGERPYKCHLCPSMFVSSSERGKHLKTLHKDAVVKVDV